MSNSRVSSASRETERHSRRVSFSQSHGFRGPQGHENFFQTKDRRIGPERASKVFDGFGGSQACLPERTLVDATQESCRDAVRTEGDRRLQEPIRRCFRGLRRTS